MKDGAKIIEEVVDMTKIFQERIQFIQMMKYLTMGDFSKVARIKSMLIV